MKILKEDLKSKNFKRIYLLFGNENYLKRYYENEFKKNVVADGTEMINTNIFEGKSISPDSIIDASNTFPFMSDKRLVIVKHSELFQTGRKDDSNKIKDYISNMPESTCIVFIENEIDKRGKLYKEVHLKGYDVELKSPKENELVSWIQNKFKKENKYISSKVAMYMLKTVGTDMDLLTTETEKLISYSQSDISEMDIDEICSKSLETKIFTMLDAIGNKNCQKALNIYKNMVALKESPIKILTMIVRQFRLILQIKFLDEKKCTYDLMAQRLGIRNFTVKGFVEQSKNFSYQLLLKAMEDCLETDIAIKTGEISAETAVEILISKYSTI